MSGPFAVHAVHAETLTETAPARWGMPLANTEFDRRHELRAAEAEALKALSPLEMRRNRARGIPRRTAGHWTALARLVEPLDAARSVLHHVDDIRYRRAGAHAVAVVLAHCAASNRAYWGWTAWDWAMVCGPSSQAFLAAQPLPIETTVRPFVMALGYLLGEFNEYQHLGNFNRLHLANLVFGAEPIEDAMSQASAVMEQWGYLSQTSDDGRYRLPGILSQALLINRSPRLQDLSTTAFAALNAHPATSGRHPASLHALQRVLADMGHCDPPVRPGHNHSPGIIGAHPTWASWVERWHDTSTLTPKVRAIVRTLMAKAGRWLAVEHPEIIEPGQWTRSTCAAWVAAIDRMAVGDHTQRRDGLGDRRGEPDCPAHQGPHPHGQPRLLPRLPGMGVDPTPLRPHPGTRCSPQRRRADRHRPADHRRRRLGQADVGRSATSSR